MDLSGVPLARIRARLDANGSARSTRRLIALLRGDPRRGAQRLADELERNLAQRRAESLRVSGLFALHRRLRREGMRLVAGVDEVGMGPLAGPVVAPRVQLPGLNDSKKLAPAVRERLAEEIRSQAEGVSVAEVSAAQVDRLNIYRAGLEAMRRAVIGLEPAPDHVVVDARTIPGIEIAQTPLVGGDSRDGSVAAASIVAKVYRDALMKRLDQRYPGYGFVDHKGYGTRQHLAALQRLGPSPEHRRSFAPVAELAT